MDKVKHINESAIVFTAVGLSVDRINDTVSGPIEIWSSSEGHIVSEMIYSFIQGVVVDVTPSRGPLHGGNTVRD